MRTPFQNYSDLKPDDRAYWSRLYEELKELLSHEDPEFVADVRNVDLVAANSNDDANPNLEHENLEE